MVKLINYMKGCVCIHINNIYIYIYIYTHTHIHFLSSYLEFVIIRNAF